MLGLVMDEAALELVRRMLDGPAAALELFARQWCACSEDVVQEALLKLARERPLPANPVAWLYVAVRRGAISASRSADRRRRHESKAARRRAWFEPNDADRLDAQAAAEALQRLPLEQREVLIAHLWGGLSFEEIGELVGCSSSAAHRRHVAAIAALRENLGETCPGPATTAPRVSSAALVDPKARRRDA